MLLITKQTGKRMFSGQIIAEQFPREMHKILSWLSQFKCNDMMCFLQTYAKKPNPNWKEGRKAPVRQFL